MVRTKKVNGRYTTKAASSRREVTISPTKDRDCGIRTLKMVRVAARLNTRMTTVFSRSTSIQAKCMQKGLRPDRRTWGFGDILLRTEFWKAKVNMSMDERLVIGNTTMHRGRYLPRGPMKMIKPPGCGLFILRMEK